MLPGQFFLTWVFAMYVSKTKFGIIWTTGGMPRTDSLYILIYWTTRTFSCDDESLHLYNTSALWRGLDFSDGYSFRSISIVSVKSWPWWKSVKQIFSPNKGRHLMAELLKNAESGEAATILPELCHLGPLHRLYFMKYSWGKTEQISYNIPVTNAPLEKSHRPRWR